MTYIDRFEAKLDIKAGECWPFIGHKNSKGYGRFNMLGDIRLAHRVAWLIFNGQIPQGMCVLHTCDNPPCCNPSHLFLGTDQDNSNDKFNKGREVFYKGSQAPNSILTEVEVIAIRRLLACGRYTSNEIGAMFGVTGVAIRHIKLGNSWRHVS